MDARPGETVQPTEPFGTLFEHMSLRTKLVLSYLIVIISTVAVLSFAVSFAVQRYYDNDLRSRLTFSANAWQEYMVHSLHFRGDANYLPKDFPFNPQDLVVVMAPNGRVNCLLALQTSRDNCNDPKVITALQKTIQDGITPIDNFTMSTDDGRSISSLYTTRPIPVNDRLRGAIFVAEPQIYPGSSFLQQINQAIILAGLVIAAIALLLSVLFISRLTSPLVRLTEAAERLKRGDYAQRVPKPKVRDELGQLGQTFNEMADTIQADIVELKRQDQVRRELIANIAHDLATPLTAIQGLSEAIADDVISDADARHETAQRIAREVQRLRRMVAEIQQMTSLEAGHTKLHLAPLDLHAQVDETLSVLAPECEHQGIRVYNDIPRETPPVLADGDRVTQVLLNLLDNARRHTSEGGQIRVGAQSHGSELHVWVSDTGKGIEPEHLPHIFERFYRADRSRTGATGGSGLGLSIVKAIITAHRGQIWAESTPGRGTCISFTLPLVTLTQSTTPMADEEARQYRLQPVGQGQIQPAQMMQKM